ncbi:DNA ligase 4-like [Tropilaelaps mercedesae]|uniref:DNA ligase n=1 Tax=Tropilaelaps mercedesae TaxID=418985 RepID=A0A1V9XU24_9ACAR|nr:DNA ligase 4-like [Tropilaelaps mercedesae]
MSSQPKYTPSVSGNTPFRALCQVLEQVQNSRQGHKSQKRTKEEMLRAYIKGYRDSWPKLERALKQRISPEERGKDLFQLVRLLLPKLDTTRGPYHMKETLIAKEYIKLIGLKTDSKKAQDLLHYKRSDPAQKDFRFRKSFDVMIFELLNSRLNFKGDDLKIDRINEILDNMTASRDEFKVQLKYLYNHCTALEHKWLARIILKSSLNVRKDVAVILNTIHPLAIDMFAVNHNLEDICMTLYDYDLQVDIPRVCVGKPFGFMLSARTNLATVESDMANDEFFMEIKFDGERVQVHKKDAELSYFSRGYGEYSHVYGESTADQRTLGEYLGRSIDPHVVTCILDGEMMSYNKQKKKFVSKGCNVDVKRMHVDDVVNHQCFVVFDCLYHNGRLLTEEPFETRRSILESFLTPIEGRVQLSKVERGKCKEDVVAFMNRAIDAKEEGIVVKMASSKYVPNHRDAGWVKLKPDYMNEVISDLDVLIVGAYFADGNSKKAYDAFLVAVAEDPVETSATPEYFYSFARVHSGLSKALIDRVLAYTGDHWKAFDKLKLPHWLKLSSMTVAPDVTIEPRYSLIITMKAAELVPSSTYMTGCTTRFSRVTAVREDKPWSDCMRYSDLQKLRRDTGDKLVTGNLENDLQEKRDAARGKKRKHSPQRKIKVHLENRIVQVKRVKSDCLAGKEFCVLLDRAPREELEKAIKKHGGRCVLAPIVGSTYMVVADKFSLRVREIMKKRDVAKVSWLVECIDRRKFREPGPADLLGMTPATEERMYGRYDRYGDSYQEETTEGMLKNVMEDMRIPESVLAEAYGWGELARQLLNTRKKFLKEKAVEFAGKTFFVESDVDFMWRLRIVAYSGILVEDSSDADMILGIHGDEEKDRSHDDDNEDLRKNVETRKSVFEKVAGARKVSIDWIGEIIEGF